jgi:succinylglutamate desuccinylase
LTASWPWVWQEYLVRFSELSDASLRAYLESVRRQVMADAQLKTNFRLIGQRIKQYADEIQAEMRRRQLDFTPIAWR